MNQEVELTLGTVGPGQYGTPTISSPAIRFEGMTFPAVQNPGGPTQVFNFRAVAAGTAVVTIRHDTKPAPFTLTAWVCRLSSGLPGELAPGPSFAPGSSWTYL